MAMSGAAPAPLVIISVGHGRLRAFDGHGAAQSVRQFARWLTNWKARSGGSCLFKARITTAWEW